MNSDKKTKKRVEVLRTRLKKLTQQLAGARAQCDDPGEVAQLELDLSRVEAELQRLTKD